MPYTCTVVRCEKCHLALDVEPEQPDAEPFYQRDDFALGLLLGDEPNALSEALGEDGDPIEEIAAGRIDATRFIRSVTVSVQRRGSVRDDTRPVARYAIEVTDPRWIASFSEGDRWESYVWSEASGPCLADDDLFEPSVALPVDVFARLGRVSVHPDTGIGPGALLGRGVVEESKTSDRVPPYWKGGRVVYRIRFDHGPLAWAFAESLRRPAADSYERAWTQPESFWTALLAMKPLDRARRLHFLGLRGGGSLRIQAEGMPEFSASIEGTSAWMFGLLRRLPLERATAIATSLLDGWLTDTAARSKRFDRATPGHELAAHDTIEDYQFECYAPAAFVLGALTLLFAEQRARAPRVVEGELRSVLAALPPSLFGYSNWRDLAAYPRAACDGSPPALPAWLFEGHRRDGAELMVDPLESDLYRP